MLNFLDREARFVAGIVTRNTFMMRLLAVLTMGGVAAAGKETVMRPYLIAESERHSEGALVR